MEFWGIEVKPGKPVKVTVAEEKVLHLSQASLGEIKKDKGNESVPLFVKFNNQKLVLGHLSAEKFPQQSFDLVFEKEFELSHNSKNGSVYFTGYQSVLPDDSPDDSFYDSEDESEDEPMVSVENGNAVPKVENAKPASTKAIVTKPEQPSKDVKSKESDEDDDESDDEEDESDDEDGESDEDVDSDDDDESDEEDDETPKKVDLGKKRPAESATKTPVPSKKAKSATPQKTDGKKGGHTATPHPSKQAGKTPANGTPKSGSHSCKSCSKTFNSGGALQSHSKAKHGGS